MKRLHLTLLSAILLLAVCVPQLASAASSNWHIAISKPDEQTVGKTFHVQYVALSTEADDHITVKLYQDEELLGSRTTTEPYGDSGSFDVTVQTAGSYAYHLVAKSTVFGDTKSSENVTVAVHAQPAAVQNSTDTDADNSAPTDNATSTGSADNDDKATDQNSEGQVLADANQDQRKPAKASRTAWYTSVSILVVGLAAVLYWLRRRAAVEL